MNQNETTLLAERNSCRFELVDAKRELAALRTELAETKMLLAHKNDTANVFMGQVKKLQVQLASTQRRLEQAQGSIVKLGSELLNNKLVNGEVIIALQYAVEALGVRPVGPIRDRCKHALAGHKAALAATSPTPAETAAESAKPNESKENK